MGIKKNKKKYNDIPAARFGEGSGKHPISSSAEIGMAGGLRGDCMMNAYSH
jgi:hypothetical protein